jgi:predicted RNA-binding protein YlqC (UPF0109 family)
MGHELNAEKLVLRIVFALVDDTKDVQIRSLMMDKRTMFEVTVAPTDVGKIIGKQGRNARAIRELLSAIGAAAKKQYGLDIVATRLTGPPPKETA